LIHQDHLLATYPSAARLPVFVMMAIIVVTLAFGVVGLRRKEQPRSLAILTLLTNVVLLGLFWHFQFYALGFDQDTWAPS
jgi:type IV secretory pathway TrbL component